VGSRILVYRRGEADGGKEAEPARDGLRVCLYFGGQFSLCSDREARLVSGLPCGPSCGGTIWRSWAGVLLVRSQRVHGFQPSSNFEPVMFAAMDEIRLHGCSPTKQMYWIGQGDSACPGQRRQTRRFHSTGCRCCGTRRARLPRRTRNMVSAERWTGFRPRPLPPYQILLF
jgi:hypothetical protein